MSLVLGGGKGVLISCAFVQVFAKVDLLPSIATIEIAGLDSLCHEAVPDPIVIVAVVGDKIRDQRHDLEPLLRAVVSLILPPIRWRSMGGSGEPEIVCVAWWSAHPSYFRWCVLWTRFARDGPSLS